MIEPLLIHHDNDKSTTTPKIKEEGIYLITGGAGGLGRIFAQHISKTHNTRTILTGRSNLSKEKQAAIQKIRGAEYHVCDITDKKAVTALIASIKERHGRLDGIIHSTGVIRDSFLLKKTNEEENDDFFEHNSKWAELERFSEKNLNYRSIKED